MLKKIFFHVLVASCLLQIPTFAQSTVIPTNEPYPGTEVSQWSSFDFTQLKLLVQQKKINTIEGLMKVLPTEIKQNPLLVYDSLALKRGLVSFETPRIILFNRDASLILSISRNPGESEILNGKDSIEGMAFNKQSNQWVMFDELFNGKEVPFGPSMQLNSAVCLSCHGANPRPLFQDYNGWSGFYGSFGTTGVAVTGSPEYLGLNEFLKTAAEKPRYKELDLGGFYHTSAGFAFAARGFSSLHDKVKFNPNLSFGVEVEKLMHRRLAAKIVARSTRSTTAKQLLPILMYLGEDSQKFGVVESRCGHPNERTNKVYELILALNSKNGELLSSIEDNVSRQIQSDHAVRLSELGQFNVISRHVDPRGVASIPYANFYEPTLNKVPDEKTFRRQMTLMELVFQKLRLKTEDVSTSNRMPTIGVFHLSRLGRIAVDEQYFQNLMQGFRAASPSLVQQFHSLSCQDLETLAMESVQSVFKQRILVAKNGVLYFATE